MRAELRRRRFSKIYKKNLWGNSQSRSGDGSTLEYTENIRVELPRLFLKYDIRSVLDGPCGDFNWMSLIAESNPSIFFIGVDIVPELVKQNQSRYSKLINSKFQILDIVSDPLPNIDLMIVRDCLFHFPERDVHAFVRNFLASGIPWLLTTSHLTSDSFENVDIKMGEFRQINLFKSPYLFPHNFEDSIDDWIPPHPPRKLFLWSRESLEELLFQ